MSVHVGSRHERRPSDDLKQRLKRALEPDLAHAPERVLSSAFWVHTPRATTATNVVRLFPSSSLP